MKKVSFELFNAVLIRWLKVTPALKLKMIAALAGINTNMASGGDGVAPKSALVTTHTARRSAATNLLLDGVPISEIMQLGGWKNEATLRHYLLAGGIQLARLSADRAFFL